MLVTTVIIGFTATQPAAGFANESCTTGGVRPTDPLLFTCQLYGAVLLRVLLPSGDQEIVSLGDTFADIHLPSGFTAVSLDITEVDNFRRNFNLTIFIANATLLNGGEITCDNTTLKNRASAGCLISKLLYEPLLFSLKMISSLFATIPTLKWCVRLIQKPIITSSLVRVPLSKLSHAFNPVIGLYLVTAPLSNYF